MSTGKCLYLRSLNMQVILCNKDILIMKFLKLGHFPNLEVQTCKVAIYVYNFACWLYVLCV